MSESHATPPQGRGDQLAGLISALRGAGLDPDRAGLADALWLAQYARPTAMSPASRAGGSAPEGGRPAGPGRAGAAAPGGDRPDPPASQESGGPRPAPAARPPHPDDHTIGLYADQADPGLPADGPRVGVPEARALPGLLELERALRPLKGYRPPARPHRSSRLDLDERATAEDTARAGGLLLPVFRRDPRGQVELQLLMDATPAMRVWQRMLGELTEVFARIGAFRDIQVHYLHESPDGALAISRRLDPGAAPLRPARQLADPTGRRLTVLVSDCTGPLWRDGAAHRLLYRLSRHAQVAVVQPLPQRLWARTRLPVSYGTLLREEGPGASARLRFRSDEPRRRNDARGDAVPVPVMPPTPAALGAWAGLLSGPGAGSVRAAVGWVRPDQPAAAPARRPVPRGQRPAAALLARFRATASPGAAQLAVYLAAAPLYLPVMQLVQRTMLPDSGPAELAEVMLSGLLRRRGGAGGDDQWYEFADGVHDELLADLGHDEALLVLKHCSSYVEQRFGKGGPNFPALALAQLSGEPAPAVGPAVRDDGEQQAAPDERVPQPFAEVAAKVLRRFLPDLTEQAEAAARYGPPSPPPSEAVGQARELARRYESDGRVRHLLDAVALMRHADRASRRWAPDPQLWTELAELLLRLWRVQREAGLLTEAEQVARAAAAHPGSGHARTVLARVLRAQAGERRLAGDRAGALELLRQADREYAAVYATPGLASQDALGPALERADALTEQWRLGGDTGLLQEAAGMLEAVAAAWPDDAARPSALSLKHGRTLLLLAQQTSHAGAGTLAQQAAVSLEAGARALAAESATAPAVARALLDLADALLLTWHDWPRAEEVIERARALADSDALRAGCLVRLGRLRVRRYAAESGPAELEAAAAAFDEASGLFSNDQPEYGDLLQEWGAALLRRAALPGGGPFVGEAVRVLRNCRMETSAADPRLPDRLLMLGQALVARYRLAGDLVDLREAEHLFDRAARGAGNGHTRARAWFELGATHRGLYRHTRAPERLDQAAACYGQAAARALEAERRGEPGGPALVRLAATALHQRGVVYEESQRPLAAAEAYRAAQAQWRRLPDGDTAGQATARRLGGLRGGG
ncbi:SAV_2336 N-terminal domain-related protein [Streptomyces sp. 7-21]|uniref:SAV_2336 N-terminal domain-related protein n=1 Tax=Streptomyces sp. 7-21 TaxID=2802283 RepID=UPI00191D35F6|nr:SAV_2336 N-terminal domain-related protein [Streptomyces sp. 7-21]MBL1065114.1 hypothetical protein [Streptomyces sp. 7-21]